MLTCRNEASAPPDPLADLYPYRSSLDGVDLQRGSPSILFGLDVDLIPQPPSTKRSRSI